MRDHLVMGAICTVFMATALAQAPDSPAFAAAKAFIQADQDRFVRELVTLTEIPAPPFKEAARAKAFADLLRQAGLAGGETDPEGNGMGGRAGGGRGWIVFTALLDPAFPEGTDVKVKRRGPRLSAPGVGDDTRGLALI